ncbi:50S ribosomal protein L4 [Candidatus Similichlamydia laticola]|uniref:Large ribosomal subunit protein uL4 n=1 Tax=Candidatus Similichlamydia laticola TaxID=2170265 RepID=A0A369KBT5_9BACT|nr:50S ribosomal protein L4 [Candidatus Similichlamydia laticola]RDB31378.1 LSU ribosomal protein L4p (L1e) [Candidatus Similichlamydia laticola]
MSQVMRRVSFPDAGVCEGVDLSSFLEAEPSSSLAMMHRCLVCLRANKRQRSACSLTRSEVSHSGKKPHPQKGTGRARQGSLASPQYRGGGVVFGPRGVKSLAKVNKKERRASLKGALLDRLSSGACAIGVDLGAGMERPKTSLVCSFLEKLSFSKGKVLVLFDQKEDVLLQDSGWSRYSCFQKSAANLSSVRVLFFSQINLQDVLSARGIVFSEAAFLACSRFLEGGAVA